MDIFRKIFGFPNGGSDRTYDDFRFYSSSEEEPREGLHTPLPDDHDGMGFNIFTNPLEMHVYFEKQMNEFLKQFQMEDHGSFFGGVPEFPMVGEGSFQGDGQNSGSLRDQYIKPGYEKSGENKNESRKDTDLDEKFKIGDLDTILKKPEWSIMPSQRQPQMRVFGQTVQYKTVKNPDGSVEIQKVVRDNSGNEERTITRKFGDKEHTVIIKRDSEGREERTENLINMDSNDENQLWQKRGIQENQNIPFTDSGQDGILSSLFGKFFK